MTMMYLPEDHQQEWLNMMRMYKLGVDLQPDAGPWIEFHDPQGTRWVANTYGKEDIFGKNVQRGISARMLEYANELLFLAYETTPICLDQATQTSDLCVNLGMTDDEALWYEPVIDPATGQAVVKFDPTMVWLDSDGFVGQPPADCNASTNVGCSCENNRSCIWLGDYTQVLQYMYQFVHFVIYEMPGTKGVYD